jgi:hypothetical protein
LVEHLAEPVDQPVGALGPVDVQHVPDLLSWPSSRSGVQETSGDT